MDRRLWIVIGVLVLLGIGFMFFSTMTGGVVGGITGVVVATEEEMRIESESFRISDFGKEGEGGNEDGKSRSG